MCCHHQISTSWFTCPQLTTSTCTSRSPVVGRGGIGILGSFFVVAIEAGISEGDIQAIYIVAFNVVVIISLCLDRSG